MSDGSAVRCKLTPQKGGLQCDIVPYGGAEGGQISLPDQSSEATFEVEIEFFEKPIEGETYAVSGWLQEDGGPCNEEQPNKGDLLVFDECASVVYEPDAVVTDLKVVLSMAMPM